jgi:hypothetical protein
VPLCLIGVISLASGLVIQGRTDCPSPTEVASQLAPLLPEELGQPDRVLSLSADADLLTLTLSTEGGEVLAKRTFPRQGSCAAQAKRVAVVTAAWQAELDDEPLPPPPKAQPEALEVQAGVQQPAHPAPSSSDLHFEMGVRMISTPGPQLQFELGMGKSWGRWGIVGNVEGGNVDGASIAALLGPTFFLLQGYPTLGLRAQGVLALGKTSMALVGIPPTETLSAIPGMEVGFRVTMGSSGARGFVDLAYLHYFLGDSPPPNQGIVTVGFAFGGPG